MAAPQWNPSRLSPVPVLLSSPIAAFLSPPIASPSLHHPRGPPWLEWSPRPGHRRATREKDGGTGSWGSSAPSRGAPPPSSPIAGRRGCRETKKEMVLFVPRRPGRSATSDRLAGDQQQHNGRVDARVPRPLPWGKGWRWREPERTTGRRVVVSRGTRLEISFSGGSVRAPPAASTSGGPDNAQAPALLPLSSLPMLLCLVSFSSPSGRWAPTSSLSTHRFCAGIVSVCLCCCFVGHLYYLSCWLYMYLVLWNWKLILRSKDWMSFIFSFSFKK
jgi:hypothetical protein